MLVNAITSFSDRPLVLIFYLGLAIGGARIGCGRRTSSSAGCSSAILLARLAVAHRLGVAARRADAVLPRASSASICRRSSSRPSSGPIRSSATSMSEQPNAAFPAILETVARYYAERLRAFGPTPRGVDWNSAESQALRFGRCCRCWKAMENASIIDYGCGYGALVDYLGGTRPAVDDTAASTSASR